jgi:methylthioribose-1-phosphate isomerase
VTPAELISGIITEAGIIRAPFAANLAKVFRTS